MDSEAKQFLFRILNTPSPSGFESEGQKVWMNYVGRFADSVENDAYGTAWATLNGRDPAIRVMLEAHADEIGFMIQNITDDGFLYVTQIGGSDRAIARGKRVRILGEKGPVLGVIGNVAIHLRDKESDKVPEIHELYLDISAKSKSEVENRGIRVGHPAIYTDTAEEVVPGRIVGRAIDNRIGGFILRGAIAALRAVNPRLDPLAYQAPIYYIALIFLASLALTAIASDAVSSSQALQYAGFQERALVPAGPR